MMEARALRRLAIYCGSATPADPAILESAHLVGRTLAERGIGVVYGGGRLGLMGAVAEGALTAGGEVVGVIPDALVEAELAHRGLSELHTVRTMHERKALFTELADGFLTLPGGTGTMDELWEAVSWAQLGYHAKPVGLYNVAGFYDELIAFNETMKRQGFIRSAHRNILIASDDLDDLLARMASYAGHVAIIHLQREEL